MDRSIDEMDGLDLSQHGLSTITSQEVAGITFGDLTVEQRQIVVDTLDTIIGMSSPYNRLMDTLHTLKIHNHKAAMDRFVRHGKDLASGMRALATVYDNFRSRLPDDSKTYPIQSRDSGVSSLFLATSWSIEIASCYMKEYRAEALAASREADLDDDATLVECEPTAASHVRYLVSLLAQEALWLRDHAVYLEKYRATSWAPENPGPLTEQEWADPFEAF